MILLPKIVTKDHTVDMNKYDYSQVEIFKRNLNAEESKSLLLTKLTKVGGSLIVSNSKNFLAPKLYRVDGSLFVEGSTNFQAPSLTTIESYLDAYESTDFQAPKLTTVKGSLWANHTNNFLAPKLTTVIGIIGPGSHPGTRTLQEINEAPVEELPLLLIKYKRNPFLSERTKLRLQHDPTTKDC